MRINIIIEETRRSCCSCRLLVVIYVRLLSPVRRRRCVRRPRRVIRRFSPFEAIAPLSKGFSVCYVRRMHAVDVKDIVDLTAQSRGFALWITELVGCCCIGVRLRVPASVTG